MKKCDCFMCNGFFIDDDDECDCDSNQDAIPPPSVNDRHVCKPKEYVGFSERFFFCEECGKKLES